MSYLELDGARHAIPHGEVVIGSDASSFLVLEGEGIHPRHVVVATTPDGQASVRLAVEGAGVAINGVALGPQPWPLGHGDKIQLGGRELTFVDERRSGSTQFVTAEDIARLRDLSPQGAPGAARPAAQHSPTASTGGRLVCLTDGREYEVTGSLVIGREASCDVVIAHKRVSRRHAEIMATPKGYVIVDMSSNGTFVNGERVAGERVLARADVLRIGDDEFRFYADSVAAAPPAAPSAPPGDAAPGAAYRLNDTLHGLPGNLPGMDQTAPARTPQPPESAPPAPPPPAAQAPSAPAPPPASPPPGPAPAPEPAAATPSGDGTLAYLVVRSGQLKGHRFPIRVPVVNVGRAEYNDIVVPDPSVSSAHCKIQLREGIWVLSDLESTNGSFVDGARVVGDAAVAPGATIKLGDVSVLFEPTNDDSAQQGGGTQVLGAFTPPSSGM